MSVGLIAAAAEAPLNRRDGEGDQIDRDTDRGTVPEQLGTVFIEARPIGVGDNRCRRESGATTGHCPHGVKDLERVDHVHDQQEEGRWSQERKRHMPESLPPGGTIDRRRLVDRRIDPLETGKVNEHVEPDSLPQGDEDDGCHRPESIGLPRRRCDAHSAENPIDEAVALVEHPCAEHPRRDPGDDKGKEYDGSEDGTTGQNPVEQHGNSET